MQEVLGDLELKIRNCNELFGWSLRRYFNDHNSS